MKERDWKIIIRDISKFQESKISERQNAKVFYGILKS
jgi:hypothetical protein